VLKSNLQAAADADAVFVAFDEETVLTRPTKFLQRSESKTSMTSCNLLALIKNTYSTFIYVHCLREWWAHHAKILK